MSEDTTRPVGMCVMRTAEYVVFTDCPPGPDEQNVSIRKSLSLIATSTSSASGRTATVIADGYHKRADVYKDAQK